MIDALLPSLLGFAEGGGPMEGIKHFVDILAYPYWSFTLTLVAFYFMLRARSLWTRRAGLIMLAAGVVFFVLSLFDSDFKSIVAKPDNVPIVMMVFLVGFFVWFAMHKATENDARLAAGQPTFESTEVEDRIFTWPDLVFSEFICMVLLTVGMVIWSIVLKAPLEEPANPALAPNPSKAPWYFLGLQEMLVYFDPWLAGVVLPGLIIVGLMAIPYIDTNPKGNGYYTFRERRVEIALFLFGFLILWSQMIVIGTFLRGPNWNFFGPYEYWDPGKVEAAGQRRPFRVLLDQAAQAGPAGQLVHPGAPRHPAHGLLFLRTAGAAAQDAVVPDLLREDGPGAVLHRRHAVPVHDAAADQDVLPLAVQPEVFRAHSRVLLQHLELRGA